MKTKQLHFVKVEAYLSFIETIDKLEPTLILGFGSRSFIGEIDFSKLETKYPESKIILCSTSGEIQNDGVFDDSLVLNLISFDSTKVTCCAKNIDDFNGDSQALGEALAKEFELEDMKHLLVFSDGQVINGSKLIDGLTTVIPDGISITGGMAGDGALFQQTLVGLNDRPQSGEIVAVGFYGEKIQIAHSCEGGWDSFGPDRRITKSKDNVLFELDGQSALALYKKYLGDFSKGLPGNALFFPLAISSEEKNRLLVRTILSIDEEKQSMTFAGDIPEGSFARLMKSNIERLIDGSEKAALTIRNQMENPDFILLISCVGRKLVMGPRADEELDAVADLFDRKCMPNISGFYSYGELSPHSLDNLPELHNQTMTITAFKEIE